jgi:hypothetical protein
MFRGTRLMVLGAMLLFLTLTSRVGELFFDLAVRLRGGRGLSSGQRLFLLRDFRLDLEAAVEDAERDAIPDEEAGRITLIRSLIRWLEFGDSPGPAAIPFLEGQLGGIGRDPDDQEAAERTVLVAAIHELGGDDRAAAGIGPKTDPDLLRGFGWTLHRLMRQADLTVAEVARRSDLEPSEVVAYLYGTEEPKLEEIADLALAVGVGPSVLVKGAVSGASRRPGRDAGLNLDTPAGSGDEDVQP